MSESTLQLPFKEFTADDLAGRTIVRAHEHVLMSTQTYRIRVNQIKVRDGFNVRTVYTGIEELADSVFANGYATPWTVDILKTGEIYLERGHRRLKAWEVLKDRYLSSGKTIEEFYERFEYVECFVNKTNTTELDRIAAIYTSNHICPLSPTDNAEVVNRLKVYYNMTHEDIAKRLGLSRQSVDNYAKIAILPDDVKQAISNNNISLNAALAVIRQVKEADSRAEAFQDLMSGKTTNVKNTASLSLPTAMQPVKKDEDDIDEDPDEDTFTTYSEQVGELNEAIQMLDKVDTQLSNDSELWKLLDASRRRVESVRDYLLKNQR